MFDENGFLLNSFQCGAYGNYYGFAYDDHTPYGPYLYGFRQDGSGAVIVEISVPYGAETGFTYDAIGFSTSGNGHAGGLFIQNHILPYTSTLGGIIQNETIFLGLNLEPILQYPARCRKTCLVLMFTAIKPCKSTSNTRAKTNELVAAWAFARFIQL